MIKENIKKSLMIMILSLIIVFPSYSLPQNTNINDFIIYSNHISQNLINEDVSDFSNQSFVEQLGISSNIVENDSEVQLARALSTTSYPVTPGDVYLITFKESDELISYTVQVEGDYSLDIPRFERINTKGYSLTSLEKYVESLIQQYYSFSNPSFSLELPGTFSVTVKGEVNSTTEVNSWGLSRLSDVVGSATKYADSRSIIIESEDGQINTYDLFAALKLGDLSQNPKLKSGDIITLKRAKRIVTLTGNVYKPGIYQLLDGDTVDDLINNYGGGLLNSSDKDNITISRFAENTYKNIKVDKEKNLELLNADIIEVPQNNSFYKSISVLGAISSTDTNNNNLTTNIIGMSSGKLLYYFTEGEKLSDLVEQISSRFNSSSDLENSYILRGNKRINVNLQLLLNGDLSQDQIIMSTDTLLIPFDQKFVNIQGAVDRGSSYAYVPDKKADYYIALAGGLTEYATGSIKIVDRNGNEIDRDAFVTSESTIIVEKSNFNRNLATTVAVAGLISTTVTIIYYVVQTYKGLK